MATSMHSHNRTRLITQSIRFLFGLVVVIIALSLMDPVNDLKVTLALYIPFAAILLGMQAIARRGHERVVSWGLIILTTGLVTISIVFMGFSGHSGTAYSVCVMLAGALLGGRAAIKAAGGIILFCTVMLWMELTGWLPEPLFTNSPFNSWMALCISLATISVLFHQTLLSLRSAITAAEQNARERDEAMQRFLTTQKMELVGQLTSGVAHDFNNLLTVVSGSVAILEEDLPEDSGDARELLRDIDAAAGRASLMTRRLLSFSRNRSAATLEAIDAARVLHELSPMLPRLLGTPITVQLRAPTPANILATRAGLEQILLNLAVNAREAMPDGGTLTLTIHVNTAEVQLIVEDTGIGMDETTRARIFEPFFTTKDSGTGLGLATVSALLRQFGGTVNVQSTEGRGTRFTLTFPHALELPQEEPGQTPAEPLKKGLRVLLVDDNPLVRRATLRMLRSVHFEVTAVVNGEEALGLLSSSDSFDVIVTDLSMPRLDGAAMAEELARRGSSTAVVFISGNHNPPLQASLPFPNTFLTKPFTTSTLVAAINQITA